MEGSPKLDANDIRLRLRMINPSVITQCVSRNDLNGLLEQLDCIQSLTAFAIHEDVQACAGSGLVTLLQRRLIDSNNNTIAAVLNTRAAALGRVGLATTVWERDDLFVRLVIEEGKTNLLLRLAIEVAELTQVGHQAFDGLRLFLDILLAIALSTVEAVQTADIAALLKHVKAYLKSSKSGGQDNNIFTTHEAYLMIILSEVMASFERLRCQEAIIAELKGPDGLFPYMIAVLEQLSPSLVTVIKESAAFGEQQGFPSVVTAACCKMYLGDNRQPSFTESLTALVAKNYPSSFLTLFTFLFDSEDFKTCLKEFFPDKEIKKRFVTAMQPVIDTLLQSFGSQEMKRAVRPISDMLLRYK